VEFSRRDKDTVLLSHLDALLTEILRRIARSADPSDSEAVRARLFSVPTHDAGEKELLDDWSRYVDPELAKLFQSALEIIERDLDRLRIHKAAGEASLAIPVAHLESWIHGLNQARIALCVRHDFSEEEMEHFLPAAGNPRSIAMLQIRFYGILQELFLRELEGD